MDKKNINKIIAVVDNQIIAICVLAGIIINSILINFFGFIAVLLLLPILLVWQYKNENTPKFNLYAIKRK